ncbi:efflux RND transporter permease subunit [Ponticoccus sp. SC2-23]|uniref:efflux RND transporter permease subunit n=1 Tax=Alexandriicola marinus TaxID=2081710 RepID=UPI000FDB5722|nr:efflux RND transporter permease subunit [Alexandriicola marinus]MBM1222390.1 efflux RND transporter permease subunit [Ponticoccus sp. SC6-9]MBM1224503.1 efflux RND transporter permease subunit [Ponticoccus sp. SC6-15]MBM1229717.1 efflux RND transporter permease subunit [Ponticoccus sp. SC6-38]MBM1233469.1 efflux RND transporter permease subunit [Ponticoccus sp. SC6-45]MBM1236581.1 efflux RND transporter permease subunit [Ponticoccus sp. SC6-49]MBM1244625.1 efflux RND transporter permease s
MTGIVDWAASRARMVLAFVVLSLAAGAAAYVGLPKEGEPDIEIPAIFVSVPFPGISAEDSEKLLVRPMETQLGDLDGLERMTATAAEGYAGVALEFEFGWDKTKVMADIRDAMTRAESQFPDGADNYSINELNFSEFPIIIVNLTGDVPERTLIQVAKSLQDRIEALDAVLEAPLTGQRDEMLEVVIDPLRLEAYNVTAAELINVVTQNNLLIAAGEIETAQGSFSVKIPSSFDEPRDVYDLPVKTQGDRVVTLGDLSTISLTFEDRTSTARYNGETTVALQVVKRKGFNLIDTATLVRETVDAEVATWPEELRAAIDVGTSNDQSRNVASMVSQLEGSVLTAIALVMIVVLAALGPRPALLVGFAIPTSFLLCFALLAVMDITISNIVMFGLILAVGMLVDGAIVVVEYADKRISEGSGPMHAYVEAAKRMFWPVVSSTATTLCAFLPMLFWPGVPGQFMGMLPVTLIFVLSASLVVALVYLPVLGGVTGRMSRSFERTANWMRAHLPWVIRAALVPVAMAVVFMGAMLTLNPAYLSGGAVQTDGLRASVPGIVLFLVGAILTSITMSSARIERRQKRIRAGYRRTIFGRLIALITGNPIMPLVSIAAVGFFVVSVFSFFGENNNGVEFFVTTEPEQAIVYVQARGNLSLEEKDELVRQAEEITLAQPGIQSIFAFAGDGGLNSNTAGAGGPGDAIGQLQIELVPWDDRPAYSRETGVPLEELDGDVIISKLQAELDTIPGIQTEILNLAMGPASSKPVHLRLTGDNWEELQAATQTALAQFEATEGLILIEDTLPLPGIDWQIDVDVEKAGRYGADVATVGGMVQLVTRGLLLDTMRVDSSDEEIEIRVRLPEEDRVLSTLDTLRVRTPSGLVPLSNFVTREPVEKLAQIDRIDQERYFDVKAAVEMNLVKITDTETGDTRIVTAEVADSDSTITDGVADGSLTREPVNPNERIATLTEWLDTSPFAGSVSWEWTGDQEDQAESQQFLATAFMGALGLMFIILLAQFNSVYNSILVLLAVVLSTTGVLIGMVVMDQPFSIIMTGTGIVALAGIVVNNNIVLIDTYQEYRLYMPRTEAIVRTAEARIRPVLLTTITTMAGLAPMMFGLSLDFINGGYTIDSPTALWWKQLATAVVFGLGIATVLTLIFTPAMLALRVWITTYARWLAQLLAKLSLGRSSRAARDWALAREAKRIKAPELIWADEDEIADAALPITPLRAAE